jgi:ferredoxin--NADP+ reductase
MAKLEYNAELIQKINVSPTLGIFRFIPIGWKLPEFKAGQYGVLGLPYSAPRLNTADKLDETGKDPDKLIKRAYSVASSPEVKDYIEFYIALVESGELTPRLFALETGEKVWMSERILGMFTLDEINDDKNLVFVATGTGLAPYMSMIRTHLKCNSDQKFAIFHGARHSWDLAYRSELMGFNSICNNFDYVPIIDNLDKKETRWEGKTGFVQDLWKGGVLEERWGYKPTPENTRVFLCGNPNMSQDMLNLLAEEGFEKHSRKDGKGVVHVEKYWT